MEPEDKREEGESPGEDARKGMRCVSSSDSSMSSSSSTSSDLASWMLFNFFGILDFVS